jgi:glyoxylase-like metal-dependent hydrolase (beta-lactamase superfamily II)
VRYIVNSHWHWDHWYGTEAYRAVFPDVRVVAHEKTREMMMGPALAFNRPGLEQQLPAYIERLAGKVAAAEAATPPSPELGRLKQLLADDRFFLEQKAHVRHTFPDVTFTDRLTLHLGNREVQVLHDDRAVTPGDAFLYLPKEKVVVAGDLLVNPISFALSSYPTGWLRTLERIDRLDATTIVPGHGAPLHDKALLHATMAAMRRMLEEAKSAKARGLDVHQARDAVLPQLAGEMKIITAGDAALEPAFRTQFVDWFMHRVYEELNGPLTDEIAPIPQS